MFFEVPPILLVEIDMALQKEIGLGGSPQQLVEIQSALPVYPSHRPASLEEFRKLQANGPGPPSDNVTPAGRPVSPTRGWGAGGGIDARRSAKRPHSRG